jgi:hypothetical protein
MKDFQFEKAMQHFNEHYLETKISKAILKELYQF